MSYSFSVSAYVVAAICGCWRRESTVNSGIWETLIPCDWDYEYEYTNKGGYGFGQWTNVGTPHGRLYNMHEWLIQNNYSSNSAYGQLEYLLFEAYWTPDNPSRLGYTTLRQFLQSTSTNINDLVYDFLSCWEGVPGNYYRKRCEWAAEFYDYIVAHANDGQTYSFVTGNFYLSKAQMNNNVMAIFHYMNGTVPSGDYVANITIEGDGNASIFPDPYNEFDTLTLTCSPAQDEQLVSIEAIDDQGQQVPLSTVPQQTWTAGATNYFIHVKFTGETPPQPTAIDWGKWLILYKHEQQKFLRFFDY